MPAISTARETPQQLKARGAFYTPPSIARFLARWALRTATERTLEPSCGDGSFVAALAERYADLDPTSPDLAARLVGVEVDPIEADKARAMAPTATILTRSFFDLMPSDIPPVAAVIGNPPYIRYHGWTGTARERSLERSREQGVSLSGLASSWASFVVHATGFLPPGDGRLALVLPAELLHTDYAEPVRRHLKEHFTSLLIVAFDRLVFDGAQVDAVLLLASNDDQRGLRIIRLPDERTLDSLVLQPVDDGLGSDDDKPNEADVAEPHLRVESNRWSSSLDAEASAQYDALLASGKVIRLGEVASVDIGLVSGANSYFILDGGAVRKHALPKSVLRRVVQRPSDLAGIRVKRDEERRLFLPSESTRAHDRATRDYLAVGVARGVPERYKARTRRHWYRVPLPHLVADAFLPYMAHRAPRLILNPGRRAMSTNLLHGVALRSGAPDARAVVAAALSSATALSGEIEGRSYGGGVLKLETKEAERLVVPALTAELVSQLTAMFDRLDRLVRMGKAAEASSIVDETLGFDHERLTAAGDIFRQRRLGRKARR